MTPTSPQVDHTVLIGGHVYLEGNLSEKSPAFLQAVVRKLQNRIAKGNRPQAVSELGSFKVKGECIVCKTVYESTLVADHDGRAQVAVVPVTTLSLPSIKR